MMVGGQALPSQNRKCLNLKVLEAYEEIARIRWLYKDLFKLVVQAIVFKKGLVTQRLFMTV